MKLFFASLIVAFSLQMTNAQVGIGLTLTNDLYMRVNNPDADNAGQSGSAGSFLLNLGIGPKIWVGSEDVSLSIEAQAVIMPVGFSVGDFKGIGMAAFPMMAKLNFAGMSGLDKEGRFGFYVGGGIQYTRTELFYVSNGFENDGGKRSLFDTYIAQVGYGFGMSGFGGSIYGRYGWNKDTEANLFSIGLQFDFNIPKLKEINSPASSL